MIDKFTIFDASHIGYSHFSQRRNNQDAHISGTTAEGIKYGFVLDGCGSKKYSEISRLVAFFLATRIQEITKVAALEQIPEILWAEVVEFYRNQLLTMKLNPYLKSNRGAIEELLNHYFLHTILGFVSNNENTLVISRGDGSITVNNNFVRINRNNRPDYPAYFLLPWTQNYKKLPGFETQIYALSEITHLIVATDGVTEGFIRVLLNETEDVQTNADLQMVLNREFDFGETFDDDATLAGLVRKE